MTDYARNHAELPQARDALAGDLGLRVIICSRQRTKDQQTKAVMDSLPEDAGAGPAAVLSWFRRDFRAFLTARGDEIFELADAVLCADGPVRRLAGLSLAPAWSRCVV
jgi:hypothetical protein